MADKYTLSVLVENHFGVLARISTLISARGFNIDSLTVSATEDPTISRMTIVVDADPVKIEQVKNQLARLIDVIEVLEFKDGQFIDRELLLARIGRSGTDSAGLKAVAEKFGAKTTEVSGDSIVLEAMGDTKQVDALIAQLKPFAIQQIVRTGRIAMAHQ